MVNIGEYITKERRDTIDNKIAIFETRDGMINSQ